VIDVGLQSDTQGVPGSGYLTFTADLLVQKHADRLVAALVLNALSASHAGPVTGDWPALGKLGTYFNRAAGQITGTLRPIAQNSGLAPNKVNSCAESRTDGELIEIACFGGQQTLIASDVTGCDSMEDGLDAASSFSLIGNSRAAGGLGETDSVRLGHSIRYNANLSRPVLSSRHRKRNLPCALLEVANSRGAL
jgi:hypothetical protein